MWHRLSYYTISIIVLIISTLSTPALGQTEWYDEWVGAKSDNVPDIFDPGFVVEEFVTGLSFPTTMTFVDNNILVLQKNDGTVIHVKPDGSVLPNAVLDVEVSNLYEAGLLGIVSKDSSVYLYYTESIQDGEKPIGSNIYKYKWIDNTLQDPVLLKSLQVNPDAITHFGGVMVIGKDNTVYAVAGDQDNLLGTNILQNQFGPPDDTGVILPVDPTGPYYAIGIRNSFGLAIDPITGNMWATENGPSKFDEVNLFMPKSNSGWNSHMGPLKESRINHFIVSDPPLAGVGGIIKSHIQLFLTSIYSIFFLSEQYEYSEPEFSWKGTIAPTAINFAPSSFGKYENWLFVGDCNFGNIYKFELNSSRISFVFEDPNLKDLVVHEGDSMEEIHFGKGFGCITDIEFKDEYMYLVSLTEGTIFRISLTDLI